jgi:short-subunit dehydrogenase
MSHHREEKIGTALITGAGSGIGKAYARLLAEKKYDLVLADKDGERIEALKEDLVQQFRVTVHSLTVNLADPSACSQIIDELKRLTLHIDFLINNAGYLILKAFDEISLKDHMDFMRVMSIAPMELTYHLLPAMKERGYGRIINTASAASLYSGLGACVLYSASKAFVAKFSEGLAAAYECHGIHVTASCPGPTKTEIFKRAGYDEKDLPFWARMGAMAPDDVAREAYKACMAGKRVIVHRLADRITLWLLGVLPKRIGYYLTASLDHVYTGNKQCTGRKYGLPAP